MISRQFKPVHDLTIGVSSVLGWSSFTSILPYSIQVISKLCSHTHPLDSHLLCFALSPSSLIHFSYWFPGSSFVLMSLQRCLSKALHQYSSLSLRSNTIRFLQVRQTLSHLSSSLLSSVLDINYVVPLCFFVLPPPHLPRRYVLVNLDIASLSIIT